MSILVIVLIFNSSTTEYFLVVISVITFKLSRTYTICIHIIFSAYSSDDDMQSLASLLSVNNNSDIAVLEDLDEDDYTLSDNSTRQVRTCPTIF